MMAVSNCSGVAASTISFLLSNPMPHAPSSVVIMGTPTAITSTNLLRNPDFPVQGQMTRDIVLSKALISPTKPVSTIRLSAGGTQLPLLGLLPTNQSSHSGYDLHTLG